MAWFQIQCGLMVTGLALSSACFSVNFGEDQIACGASGACPPGLACGADGFCGQQPGAADAAIADAPAADAPVASPDASADAALAIDARPSSPDASLLTFAFQDGVLPDPTYAGTRDSVIREASPTTSSGNDTSLVVDGDSLTDGNSYDERALLRWDLSAIPAGSTAVAASITVQVSNESDENYPLYPVRRAWTEADVTWQQATAADPWAVAGADGADDRDGIPIAEAAAAPVGTFTIELGAPGLALVQQWIDDPASNHGIIFLAPDAGNGLDFYSRNHGTAAERPRLDLTVTPP